MVSKTDIRAEARRIQDLFERAGAVAIETDILQPADTLLELYGEDIRARAFVTHDPLSGEQMLRPDFTVPVVQAHMSDGAEPARYTYSGEVFRRQERPGGLASEHIQVGYEVFDRSDAAAADAEVFALFQEILAPLLLEPVTGDIGILTAAVRGLKTTEPRKSALLRHIWRPARFRALLDRFSGRAPMAPSRQALLAEADPLERAQPLVGLRTIEEIGDRISALHKDAAEPAISAEETELLEAILATKKKSAAALVDFSGLASAFPGIGSAVSRFSARLDALDGRGVDIAALSFEASYGRTSMEYYDGFVFGFYAQSRPDLPPVATGGRYDALTRVLGQGKSIPAVGGVIRPALALLLSEGRA
jgi:ATP phosphoribosyltransferase regulatory subunit